MNGISDSTTDSVLSGDCSTSGQEHHGEDERHADREGQALRLLGGVDRRRPPPRRATT